MPGATKKKTAAMRHKKRRAKGLARKMRHKAARVAAPPPVHVPAAAVAVPVPPVPPVAAVPRRHPRQSAFVPGWMPPESPVSAGQVAAAHRGANDTRLPYEIVSEHLGERWGAAHLREDEWREDRWYRKELHHVFNEGPFGPADEVLLHEYRAMSESAWVGSPRAMQLYKQKRDALVEGVGQALERFFARVRCAEVGGSEEGAQIAAAELAFRRAQLDWFRCLGRFRLLREAGIAHSLK
jgi:hypothetical protein